MLLTALWLIPSAGYLTATAGVAVAVLGISTPILALNEPAVVTPFYEVLEPETWVGKPLPILDHIDITHEIKQGTWLLLLYHHDCPDCRRAIARYQQMAHDLAGNEDFLRIASRSCSCVSAELGQTKLGPGRETFLGLRLHVNRPGVSVGRVAVEQRPPGLIKRYAVSAYGKDSFFTIPAIGYIEAPGGGVIEYPVRIVYYADTDDTVLFDRMDGSNGQLQLANVVAKGQGGQEYTTFIFDVTLRLTAEKPAGTAYRFGEHISFVLATSRGVRSIPFKISGVIGRPAFRLTPESLFIVTARSPEPFRRNIKVEFLTQPPPTHITVEPSEGLDVAIGTKAISAGTFLVSISAAEQGLSSLSPGMNEGQLTPVQSGQGGHARPAVFPHHRGNLQLGTRPFALTVISVEDEIVTADVLYDRTVSRSDPPAAFRCIQ